MGAPVAAAALDQGHRGLQGDPVARGDVDGPLDGGVCTHCGAQQLAPGPNALHQVLLAQPGWLGLLGGLACAQPRVWVCTAG